MRRGLRGLGNGRHCSPVLFPPPNRKCARHDAGRGSERVTSSRFPGKSGDRDESNLPELRLFVELSRLIRGSRAGNRAFISGVHRRFPKRSGGRQMTKVNNDGPYLPVRQDSFRAGHSRRRKSKVNDPLQLPVGVGLRALPAQWRYRWRHAIGKRHAGILRVQPVTCGAIMGKRHAAAFNIRGGFWKRDSSRLCRRRLTSV